MNVRAKETIRISTLEKGIFNEKHKVLGFELPICSFVWGFQWHPNNIKIEYFPTVFSFSQQLMLIIRSSFLFQEARAEEERRQNIAQEKINSLYKVPDEPLANHPDAVQVVFKLPCGRRLERRFLKTHSLEVCIHRSINFILNGRSLTK